MLHHETHQLMNQKHICQEKQGITISCSWDCAVDLRICGPLKILMETDVSRLLLFVHCILLCVELAH